MVSSRAWLLAIAVACFLAVLGALVAQHGFDMQPCPWCILQRLFFLLIAIVALVGAVPTSYLARTVSATIVALLSLAGGAAAVWQHAVAAKSASCNLTLADKILSALHLNTALPEIFEPRASCADAAVNLMGMPFEYWSLALFALLAVSSILSMRAQHLR
jgi:disulfide bond formation protein DsbB